MSQFLIAMQKYGKNQQPPNILATFFRKAGKYFSKFENPHTQHRKTKHIDTAMTLHPHTKPPLQKERKPKSRPELQSGIDKGSLKRKTTNLLFLSAKRIKAFNDASTKNRRACPAGQYHNRTKLLFHNDNCTTVQAL